MLIEAPELTALSGLRHGFFTRRGGASRGIYQGLNAGLGSSDEPDRVRENRRLIAEALGVSADAMVSVHQIHSPDVALVESPWETSQRPKADAMVTAKPGIALAILTADCGPVLFADREAGVVGAAHAGWKGALGGVLDATVASMESLGADRRNIVAVLGPTIGPGAYEVGPEFVARFLDHDPDNATFFRPSGREGHAYFDLPAYIGRRLERLDIGTRTDLGLCTYSDEESFFSYRRATHRGEPDYGRLISAITLV